MERRGAPHFGERLFYADHADRTRAGPGAHGDSLREGHGFWLAALSGEAPPELLQTAAPYELSVGSASGFFGILYPMYVRGQACLLAHRYAEAAAEFQRILEYPGVVFADPVGARIWNSAELMLGREIRSERNPPIRIS